MNVFDLKREVEVFEAAEGRNLYLRRKFNDLLAGGSRSFQLENTLVTDSVMSVAFSPDGKTLATAEVNNKVSFITLWDIESGNRLHILSGHSNTVICVAFTTGRVASGSWDNTIKVWDSENGNCLLTIDNAAGNLIRGMRPHLSSLCFSKDGSRIISGGGKFEFGKLRIWDSSTGECIKTILEDHPVSVSAVAISPDGTKVAAGFRHYFARGPGEVKVMVFDARSGNMISTLDFGIWNSDVTSVAFSPDGTKIAASTDFPAYDGDDDDDEAYEEYKYTEYENIQVWDLENEECLVTLFGNNAVMSVCFSPDGSTILAGYHMGWEGENGGAVKVWDWEDEEELQTIPSDSPVNSVSFSPDGKQIAIGTQNDGVLIWKDPRMREILNMLFHLKHANRRTRNRAGDHLPSAEVRAVYGNADALRKISEFF